MKFFKQGISITLLLSSLLFSMSAWAMSDIKTNQTITIEQLAAQNKGQWTFMEVWASDCHMCRRSIHHIEDMSMSVDNLKVYGISIDGVADKNLAQKFIADMGLTFPNYLSNAPEVDSFILRNAGETLMGTPTALLFNPQGKLVAVQPGAVTVEEVESFMAKNP